MFPLLFEMLKKDEEKADTQANKQSLVNIEKTTGPSRNIDGFDIHAGDI